jgi:hypothetical protein
MPRIAVVHLVRKKNGVDPLKRFLASYQRCPAGAEHELVLLFKGFSGAADLAGYDSALAAVAHRPLFVPDRGLDLHAYFEAFARLEHEHFCFLNSYSRVLAPDWLAKLYRWIATEGVGLVGATGSCQRIADPDAAISAPAAPDRTLLRRIADAWRKGSLAQHAGFALLRLARVWDPARDFPPFPNYHLRTNAFMAARSTLARVRPGPIRTKISAYRFESGNDSLTRRVRRLGLRVLVVGRDGEAYDPERWHLSNTFRQSRQENLLVADNQTDAYEAADSASRSEVSRHSWGRWARPG